MHTVTRNRPKHACQNCRRKKARCPGERPVCSFCDRLKQICEYDDQPIHREYARPASGQAKASKLAERVSQLETQLSVLTNANIDTSLASPTAQRCSIDSSTGTDPDNGRCCQSPHSGPRRQDSYRWAPTPCKFRSLPPDHIIRSAVDSYFAVCHNHPCTFFYEDRFRQNFENDAVPTYVLLAIVATTARLSNDPWFEGNQSEATRMMANHAWTHVLTEVLPIEENTTLAAVQTAGLLALLDYGAGSYQSATLKLRIAISMAQNLRLTVEPSEAMPTVLKEEQRYVVWTLYVMDKIAALSFDCAFILSDHECLLRLPEDVDTFRKVQRNRMPDLMTVKARPMLLTSSYAKLVFTASVMGSLVMLRGGGHTCHYPSSNGESTYMMLTARAKQLFDVLGIDTPKSTLSPVTGKAENASNEMQHSVHDLYAREIYRLIQVFINHPFFTRREIKLIDSPRSQAFLYRSLARCREQAEMLTRSVARSQQMDGFPHSQLVPGYTIFNAALVHCMFTKSRIPSIASTSQELCELSRATLLQQALADDNPRLQSYLAVLDFFLQNPGVSDLLVDPTLTSFRLPSTSPSYWRFLDFNWLCEHFCVDMTQQAASDQQSLSRQLPSRPSSFATASSDNTSAAASYSSSTPITPESTFNKMQQVSISSSSFRKSTLTDCRGPDTNQQPGELAFGYLAQTLSLEENEQPELGQSHWKNDHVASRGTIAPAEDLACQQVKAGGKAQAAEQYAPRAESSWSAVSAFFAWDNDEAHGYR